MGVTTILKNHVLKIFYLAIVFYCLVTGFAQSADESEALSYWNFEKFIYEGWTYGKNRAAIIRKLGPPLQAKTEKLNNLHVPGQVDEIHHLFYDGAYVRIYRVGEVPEREFLTDVTVTNSRYKMADGVRVGDAKERVIKLLGGKFQSLQRPDLRVEVPKVENDCTEKDNVCAIEYTDSRSHVYFSFKKTGLPVSIGYFGASEICRCADCLTKGLRRIFDLLAALAGLVLSP
jgi:hypothetical protein